MKKKLYLLTTFIIVFLLHGTTILIADNSDLIQLRIDLDKDSYNDKWVIVQTVDEYVNNVLNWQSSSNWICDFDVKRNNNGIYNFKGNYMLLGSSTNGDAKIVYKFPVSFTRNKKGEMSVDDNSILPSFRGLLQLPDSPLKKGQSYRRNCIFALSYSVGAYNQAIPVDFESTYKFMGLVKIENISYYHLRSRYFINWQNPNIGIDRYSILEDMMYPIRVMGDGYSDFYFDIDTKTLIFEKSDLDIIYIHNNGIISESKFKKVIDYSYKLQEKD